jgi:hypothetical protein
MDPCQVQKILKSSKAKSERKIGNRIPSVMRMDYSSNPCCIGSAGVQAGKEYYTNMPEQMPTGGNQMVTG